MTPLFPYNASDVVVSPLTEKLAGVSGAFALEVDYENMQLTVATKNGTLFGMNLVNRSLTDLRSNYEVNGRYSGIKKLHFMKNRMFWTVPSCGVLPLLDCLYSEEWDQENEVGLLSAFIMRVYCIIIIVIYISYTITKC